MPPDATRTGRLRVAVWQCAPTPRDRDANLERLAAVAAEAVALDAGLLVTPELTLTGYDVGDLDGLLHDDDLDRVAAIARDHGIAVVVGLALRDADGTVANASVVIDRSGDRLATYRKAHLFGHLDESRFTAGPEPFALTEVDGIPLATIICYDVEFPETVRAAALAGAELLAVPTALMLPFELVCEQVVPVRAWENQLVVAYANHCGREGDTAYAGRSVIAGTDGRPLAVAPPEGEHLIVADLDVSEVAKARRDNPYLSDRRPGLYAAVAADNQTPTRANPDPGPDPDRGGAA